MGSVSDDKEFPKPGWPHSSHRAASDGLTVVLQNPPSLRTACCVAKEFYLAFEHSLYSTSNFLLSCPFVPVFTPHHSIQILLSSITIQMLEASVLNLFIFGNYPKSQQCIEGWRWHASCTGAYYLGFLISSVIMGRPIIQGRCLSACAHLAVQSLHSAQLHVQMTHREDALLYQGLYSSNWTEKTGMEWAGCLSCMIIWSQWG